MRKEGIGMWDFSIYPHNTALLAEDGRRLSYRELDKLQQRYAGYIKDKRGLTFLICDTLMEDIIFYIACIQNKIPVMLVDSSLPKEAMEGLVDSYKPKYIWCLKEDFGCRGYIACHSINAYKLYCKEEINTAVNEELALLLLTSGSTGSKKSVRISYKNIQANMRSVADSLALDETDAAVVMLPMHYSYGLSVIHSNLLKGAALLIPNSSFFAPKFWKFLKDCHATSLCGVPYTYEVLKKLNFHKNILPDLRLITQAGGALSIELQKYLLDYVKDKEINLAIMYGQTEATARISCYFLNKKPEKMGSVGVVIPGGNIRIEDGSNKGEFLYTGENVSLGYADSSADLLKGDENKGILHTGDIGYIDGDGFLYITGRKSRMAKVLGIRINLDELEKKISRISGFTVICVEQKGYIYAFAEKQEQEDAVYEAAEKSNLDIRFLKVICGRKIPRAGNGKILYGQLQKMAGSGADEADKAGW